MYNDVQCTKEESSGIVAHCMRMKNSCDIYIYSILGKEDGTLGETSSER